MAKFFSHLGNTPELSLYELMVLTNQTVDMIVPHIAQLELLDDSAAQQLMSQVGGTVKIYRYINTISSRNVEDIISAITSHLVATTDGKITFGIASLGVNPITIDPALIKQAFRERHIASRYVDATTEYGVAAALLLKNAVTELVLINTPSQVILAQTIATQDINDWTKRDRNKPYADRKKGMLPPKVARMMVNIGLGLLTTSPTEQTVLYDPFMGSGTVLMEAILRGITAHGCDLDTQAVAGATDNLEWLKHEYARITPSVVTHRDATQHYTPTGKPWADLIVTEPFLGKPTPRPQELANMFKGLHRLYLGSFKNWTHQLKPGSPVVIVFPLVQTDTQQFSLQSLIDKLEDLGYTSVSQPVVYSRPQAIVQRQIHFFRYIPGK